MTIVEPELEIFLKCPLMDQAIDPRSRVYVTAVNTMGWLLKRSQEDGGIIPASVIREKYTAYWKSAYYPAYEKTPPPPNDKAFWEGPRKARIVAKRLYDLISKFAPVCVNYPYTLNVGSAGSIVGVLDILVRRTQSGLSTERQTLLFPMEFVYRHSRFPDITRMARWLWAFQTAGSGPPDIYNFPMFHGKPWTSPPLQQRTVLERIGRALTTTRAATPSYPVPGSHCQQCYSHRCQEIYERQDDNRG
jgi:hypothetical protein